MITHLLLSQNQHSLWLDRVVRSQILPAAPHHAILEGLPYPVTGGPRDAQVMPLPVIDEERQLCDLRQRLCVSQVPFSTSLPFTLRQQSRLSSRPLFFLPITSLVMLYPSIQKFSDAHSIFIPHLNLVERSCRDTVTHASIHSYTSDPLVHLL